MVSWLLGDNFRIRLYSTLMRVRPAQVADLLKRGLGVQRQRITASTGHTFWADPVSVFGFDLLSRRIYEPQMTKLLQLVLRPGDTFIDVGGNEGYFSVLASSLACHGQVHCVEPQTRLQKILQENIRVNRADSVTVHQVALSDGEGEAELFLRPSTNSGASSMFRHWKIGFRKENVHTTTLDSFFKENSLESVRLLKVDCEGAEDLVVAGGQNVLRQKAIDFIALEYHPVICGVERCARAHDEFKDLGYILTKTHGQYIYHLLGLEEALKPLGDLRVNCAWDA